LTVIYGWVRTLDRYGLYQRHSRATEASASIERQDEAARAEVKRRGGRVVGTFVDEGVAGALPPIPDGGYEYDLHDIVTAGRPGCG